MRITNLLTDRGKGFSAKNGCYMAFVNEDGSVRVTHHREDDLLLENEAMLYDFCDKKGITDSPEIGMFVIRVDEPTEKCE